MSQIKDHDHQQKEEPRYSIHLITDKQIYTHGEIIYVCAFLVHAYKETLFPKRPTGKLLNRIGNAIFTIRGQDVKEIYEKRIKAINCSKYDFQYTIPNDISVGQYSLQIKHLNGNAIAPSKAKIIHIKEYHFRGFYPKMKFFKKFYKAGDQVKAILKVDKRNSKLKEQTKVKMQVVIDQNAFSEDLFLLDNKGTCLIQFQLPKESFHSQVVINYQIMENDHRVSHQQHVPILSDPNLIVNFYPEGGILVDKCNCKVYLETFTRINNWKKQPISIVAEVGYLSSRNNRFQTLKKNPIIVETDEQGRGQFMIMNCDRKMNYLLKLIKPKHMIYKKLPTVKPLKARGYSNVENNNNLEIDGLVLSSIKNVYNYGEKILINLQGIRGNQYKVCLYKRERLIHKKQIILSNNHNLKKNQPMRDLTKKPRKSKQQEIFKRNLQLNPENYSGVLRITVYQEINSQEIPVSEKLIFIHPKEKIFLNFQLLKKKYYSNEKAEIIINSTNSTGKPIETNVCLRIIDNSIYSMTHNNNRNPQLLEMIYLENEVNDLLCPNIYINTNNNNSIDQNDEKKSNMNIDLLLGTQGWRKFIYSKKINNKKIILNEKEQRLLILNSHEINKLEIYLHYLIIKRQNKKLTLSITETETLRDIKRMIERRYSIPRKNQKAFFYDWLKDDRLKQINFDKPLHLIINNKKEIKNFEYIYLKYDNKKDVKIKFNIKLYIKNNHTLNDIREKIYDLYRIEKKFYIKYNELTFDKGNETFLSIKKTIEKKKNLAQNDNLKFQICYHIYDITFKLIKKNNTQNYESDTNTNLKSGHNKKSCPKSDSHQENNNLKFNSLFDSLRIIDDLYLFVSNKLDNKKIFFQLYYKNKNLSQYRFKRITDSIIKKKCTISLIEIDKMKKINLRIYYRKKINNLKVKQLLTIRELKLIISQKIGISGENQRLFLNKKRIVQYNTILLDLNITNNSEIVLKNYLEMKMIIFIQLLKKDTFQLNIKPNNTIKELKNLIQSKINLQSKDQILNYHGVQLEDNRQIKDYNILESSKLFLIRALKRKGSNNSTLLDNFLLNNLFQNNGLFKYNKIDKDVNNGKSEIKKQANDHSESGSDMDRVYAHKRNDNSAQSQHQDYTQTLYFNPNLSLKKDKKSKKCSNKIFFDLSDSSRVYRIIADCYSYKGIYGSTNSFIIPNEKSFSLKADLPSQLGPSDQPTIHLFLYNNTKKKLNLQYSIQMKEINNQKIFKIYKFNWKINSKKRAKKEFFLNMQQFNIINSKIEIVFSAKDALNPLINDTKIYQCDVKSQYYKENIYFNGILSTNNLKNINSFFLPKEKNIIANSLKSKFKVYKSSIEYLYQFYKIIKKGDNFGSILHLISTIYPLIMIRNIFFKINDKINFENRILLKTFKYLDHINLQLKKFECKNGGFSLFINQKKDLEITALVFSLLSDLDKKNSDVDERILKRTFNWIVNNLQKNKHLDSNDLNFLKKKLYTIWYISQNKSIDNKPIMEIFNNYYKMALNSYKNEPVLISLISLILFNLKNKKESLQLITNLLPVLKKIGKNMMKKKQKSFDKSDDSAREVISLILLNLFNYKETFVNKIQKYFRIIFTHFNLYRDNYNHSIILSLKIINKYFQIQKINVVNSLIFELKYNNNLIIDSQFNNNKSKFNNQLNKSSKFNQKNEMKLQINNNLQSKFNFPYILQINYYHKNIKIMKDCLLDFKINFIGNNFHKIKMNEYVPIKIKLRNTSEKKLGKIIIIIKIPSGLIPISEYFNELQKNGVIDNFDLSHKSEMKLYLSTFLQNEQINFTIFLYSKYPGKYESPISYAYEYYNSQYKAFSKLNDIIISY
ncbi:polyubiquitin-c [Anaeramoeba flamelloides]|uniref:Polyubiquitin-c n=1 Tax=Anaeramoeba flamelloides TaxID=1746091 RepID=A0ABQ8XBD8_9EUKA|nr:polyubiquitin-c [Anaeramoeba flamelloides]